MNLCYFVPAQLAVWLKVGQAVRDMRIAFSRGELLALSTMIAKLGADDTFAKILNEAAGNEVKCYLAFIENNNVR
jgi:hypothetical protein